MTILDLSAADDLQRYLTASLDERGHAAPLTPQNFRRAAQWFSALYGQGWERLPFFVVFDLGHLLLEGSQFAFRSLHAGAAISDDNPELAARVAYENRLLNRLLVLPVFAELRDILDDAVDPNPRIVAILSCWLAPLREVAALPTLQTSIQTLRQISSPPSLSVAEARVQIEKQLNLPGLIAGQREVVLEVMGNAPLSQLIGPEDLFIFRHIEALSNSALRLTARQLVFLEQQMGDTDPPPAHLRREPPQIQVNLQDAGYFPQGGLDQLANRGSIENLVRTELAYIDPTEDVDLFTMRYLEGELLYYTRDDAQLLRRSRTAHIALELDQTHHIQYPGHPAQLGLLLRAMVGRLIDDLFTIFSTDSLKVVLRLHDRRAAEAAELWKIRFSDVIARGELDIVLDTQPVLTEPTPQACAERLLDPGRQTSLILIGPRPHLSITDAAALTREGLLLVQMQVPWTPPKPNPSDDSDDPTAVLTSSRLIGLSLDTEPKRLFDSMRTLRQRLLWALFGC